MFKLFLKNRDGNFATVMALVLMPLLGVAGAAYDYAKLQEKKQRIQAAADGALLAAAREADSSTEFFRLAENYLAANYPNEDIETYAKANPDSVSLSIRDSYNTAVMGILGVPRIAFEVHSEVRVHKFGRGSLGSDVKKAMAELDRTEQALLKQIHNLRHRDQEAARKRIKWRMDQLRNAVVEAEKVEQIHLMK